MQEKNFDYLKNQIKYTGFGEGLEAQLKENMQKGETSFSLEHSAIIGKDLSSATLHFRKSNETDNYFFNRYDLSVKQEGQKDALKQTFHLGYDNNITLKEGYNLMSGRAVHKEMAQLVDTGENGNKRLEAKGEKYHAWLQMDFKQSDANGNYKIKQFHQNYGFNLEEALSKHPIKELGNNQDKKALLNSLEKGNRQSVTFVIGDKEEKRFIEASPQFKSINQYDANMQRTGWKRTQSEKEGESQKQGEEQKTTGENGKKQQSAKSTDDEDPGKKAGRSKKRGASVS